MFIRDDSGEFSLDKTFDVFYQNDDFVVYENKYFLNLGLLYDEYLNVNDFKKMNLDDRNSAYLKSVILDENSISKYEGYLKEISHNDLNKNSFDDFKIDYNKKKELGTTKFSILNDGFKIDVDSQKNGVLLLTIPYDSAWNAYIDNKKIEIDKVSNGFMAIKVNGGQSTVVFKYELKGGLIGKYMTLCGGMLYFVLIILNKRHLK